MKVINLFGMPSSGKSTIRAKLFYEMKIAGYKVEEATEYAKDMVYDNRLNILDDQLYLLAKQNRKLLMLSDKVDYLITDSPILMQLAYNNKDLSYYDTLNQLIKEVYNHYENINILLHPRHEYQTLGRTQNEDESLDIHHKILDLLDNLKVPYQPIYTDSVSLETIKHLL